MSDWGGAPGGSGGNRFTRVLAALVIVILLFVLAWVVEQNRPRPERNRGPAPIESTR